jgi:hypothetical protein
MLLPGNVRRRDNHNPFDSWVKNSQKSILACGLAGYPAEPAFTPVQSSV